MCHFLSEEVFYVLPEYRDAITGKVPELWHAETGTFEPVSYRIAKDETVVPMTLNAEESVHIVFRKPATAAALSDCTESIRAVADCLP